VAAIAKWLVPVRILQLWACLTGQAKSFALGLDEAHILRAFRTRSGLTAEEASYQLQTMRRDRRTPLEDHANLVECLAQTAFSHATGTERKRLVYNAFFRSMNHPDLQHYWLSAKVSNLGEALEMGKAYFQVEGLQGASFTAGQVAEGIEKAATPPAPQVSAARTKSPEQTQLTVLMDMVKGLQATVTELQRDQADRRTFRSRDDPSAPCSPPGGDVVH